MDYQYRPNLLILIIYMKSCERLISIHVNLEKPYQITWSDFTVNNRFSRLFGHRDTLFYPALLTQPMPWCSPLDTTLLRRNVRMRSGTCKLILFVLYSHDDVIKWKHFPRNWPFVRGIHRSPVNSPHKGQWRRALMFSLIRVWINDWVNNREAGDLRRYRAHYDVIVMKSQFRVLLLWSARNFGAHHAFNRLSMGIACLIFVLCIYLISY